MGDEPRAVNRDLSSLRIPRDAARGGRGRTVLWVVILVVLGAGGYGGWRKIQGTARGTLVETGLVRRVSGNEGTALLSAGGYILPERRASVSSKTVGRLEWLGVDVGSRLKKGDVIARLASEDLAARVEEAKASVVEAERELARWKRVVEQGMEPREKLDRADTVLQLARARLKGAEADLEYASIRAPFDGIVVRKGAEVGETVGPPGFGSQGAAICTLVDLTSLEMVADVNETNIAKIQVGQPVEIVAEAHPDRRYRGEVRQIVPTADRQKGIVQVKVKLLELDERLLPEMAARATFLRVGASAGAARRVIAPRGSVREHAGGKCVYVVDGTRVRRVAVEVGAEGEDGVEITKGLAGGERVVTGGAAVEDGVEVEIKK